MTDPKPEISATPTPLPASTVGTRGRAAGKVILLGEHAVVYGVPAIAVGIDRGAEAYARASSGDRSRLRVPAWDLDVPADGDGHDLAKAFRAVLVATHGPSPSNAPHPVDVEVHAALPPGGGLGCSAALGVAVARALDPRASVATIRERAMEWERVFHGNPSGIDAAVSASGGCIYFEKGKPIESVHVRGGLRLCVGNTGHVSSTKVMVEAVRALRERRPDVVHKAFEGIRALVRNARLAIEAGDATALGRLVDLNQMLLGGLFVSTPEIETMCKSARDAGALGAKLTGAGGGGSVVAIVPSPSVADRVLRAWEADGFHGFATEVLAPKTPDAWVSELAS
ncbi:MAG: mevalonate kinase [Polyangiaceae bacterium]